MKKLTKFLLSIALAGGISFGVITTFAQSQSLEVTNAASPATWIMPSPITSGAALGEIAIDENVTFTAGKGSANTNFRYWISKSKEQIRCYAGNTGVFSFKNSIVVSTIEFYYDTKLNTGFINTESLVNATISNNKLVVTDSSKNVSFVTKAGTNPFNKIVVTYEPGIVVTPTKLKVDWNTDKGSYINGTIKANSIFSSTDLLVSAVDDTDATAGNYNSGKGYKFTFNGKEYDATVNPVEISLEGYVAKEYPIEVTVPGVGANGADCSGTINLTVIDKAVSSYSWKVAPQDVFYSHVDAFNFTGELGATFNDTSTGVSKYHQKNIVRLGEAKTGEAYTIPTHKDGTINLANDTTITVESYFEEFAALPTDNHVFTTIQIKVPTLTITNLDDPSVKYYVGTSVTLNPEVKLTCGTNETILTAEQYSIESADATLVEGAFTPSEAKVYNFNAAYSKDGIKVLETSTPLTINAIVSTRELVSLEIDPLTLEAGSKFVLPADAAMLTFKENGVEDVIYLGQDSLVLKLGEKELSSLDYVYPSMNQSTINVSYSEGADKTVSTTFVLTVTDKVISEYTAPQNGDFEKLTAGETDYSGKYIFVANHNQSTYIFDGSKNGENVNKSLSALPTYLDATTTLDYETYLGKAFTLEKKANTNFYTFKNANNLYLTGTKDLDTTDVYDNAAKFEISWHSTNGFTLKFANTSNEIYLNYNNGTPMLRPYGTFNESNYARIMAFKVSSTPAVGDPVKYITDVIDSLRLQNETKQASGLGFGFTICDTDSGIYASDYWKGTNGKASIKDVYTSLSQANKEKLMVQDTFGEIGKTYLETMEMLISNETSTSPSIQIMPNLDSQTKRNIIIITCSVVGGLLVLGGFGLFIKKRKFF